MKYFFISVFILLSIFFNILFDLVIVFLLFCISIVVGSFFNLKIEDSINKFLIQFSLGMGSIGFLIWLNTFYNLNYKSLFIGISILLLILRRNYLKNLISQTLSLSINYHEKNPFLFYVILFFVVIYIISASYPIHTHDSLTKHLAIPLKILNSTNYDYNVIESIVFGDYAILPHMYSLYLLSLGGTKALIIFITLISFMSLVVLSRFSYRVSDRNIFINSIAIIYLTTPIVYKLSVNLMVETLSLFFILSAILLVSYTKEINKNIIFLGLIVGFAMFVKQISAFYIIPLAFYVLYIYIKERYIFNFNEIKNIFLSVIVSIAIFLPSILIIYYKTGNPFFPFMNGKFQSPYFSITDFKDPFSNILGFDFDSLWSIVFHTSKNIEMINGGVGYIFILLPIVLFLLFFKRDININILLFIALAGYLISSKLTYNIRYFYPTFVLLIPVIIYYINYIDKKIFFNKNIFNLFVLFSFSLSSLFIIFHEDNYWGFKNSMLKPNSELIENPNKSVLKYIPNEKNIKILSNNDQQRGDFLGYYYGLGWYNTYIIEEMKKNNISPISFLSNFDYYLVSKLTPLKYKEKFDPDSQELENNLVLVIETESHKLYKIKTDFNILINEQFISPLIVSVEKPEIKKFDVISTEYQIIIESELVDETASIGRFQINWLNNNKQFIGTSITTYNLKEGVNIYKSNIINDVPKNAVYGVLYINSHLGNIKVYSIKLLYSQKNSFLDKLLEDYNQRFPHLINFKE